MEIRINDGKILVGETDKMEPATQETLIDIISLSASCLGPLKFELLINTDDHDSMTLISPSGSVIYSDLEYEDIAPITSFVEGLEFFGFKVEVDELFKDQDYFNALMV